MMREKKNPGGTTSEEFDGIDRRESPLWKSLSGRSEMGR
jgi:hypothetical protein